MKSKAFSLIEILVSLFIISIIIIICIAKYDFTSNALQKTEVNTLITDIKTARNIAMNSGRSVHFRMQEKSYKFVDGTGKIIINRNIEKGRLYFTRKNPLTTNYVISKSSAASGFPSITYESHNYKYELVAQIASGRIRVNEIKK